MPYRSKGPRLYLRRARRDKEGEHAAIWIIRECVRAGLRRASPKAKYWADPRA